jgi:hypothetical protein
MQMRAWQRRSSHSYKWAMASAPPGSPGSPVRAKQTKYPQPENNTQHHVIPQGKPGEGTWSPSLGELPQPVGLAAKMSASRAVIEGLLRPMVRRRGALAARCHHARARQDVAVFMAGRCGCEDECGGGGAMHSDTSAPVPTSGSLLPGAAARGPPLPPIWATLQTQATASQMQNDMTRVHQGLILPGFGACFYGAPVYGPGAWGAGPAGATAGMMMLAPPMWGAPAAAAVRACVRAGGRGLGALRRALTRA